ncbi:hypothetical protein GCM10009548_29550 [Streptomyces malaysiensis subsp. malaysiensis]
MTRVKDSVAEVSTIIRAGRSERTHTSPDDAVTSPTCTPHWALGRPESACAGTPDAADAADATAGTASAAEAAADPCNTVRRPIPLPDSRPIGASRCS